MIVRKYLGWGGGCLVRGIPRCCSPSAPGKEREKEGEFFLFGLRRRTPISWCDVVNKYVHVCNCGQRKGLNFSPGSKVNGE